MSEQQMNDKLVLGVSGSSVPNSNTDRAVQMALAATGCRTQFVKLSDYVVAPCRACLGCVQTNRCVINDDGRELATLVRAADALIVGGYAPYCSLDARTKTFLERLYPLRHLQGLMRGKPGGGIVTHGAPEMEGGPAPHALAVQAITMYMLIEGMHLQGVVPVQGNLPCVHCGKGEVCDLSALRFAYGPEATVESVGQHRVEEQPQAHEEILTLGRRIGEALRQRIPAA